MGEDQATSFFLIYFCEITDMLVINIGILVGEESLYILQLETSINHIILLILQIKLLSLVSIDSNYQVLRIKLDVFVLVD